MANVPKWVERAHEEFTNMSPREDEAWVQNDPKRWSTIVAIHYPPIAYVYYVVDALLPNHPNSVDDWYQLQGTHMIQELADNAARKRAYKDQVPHRVRMVVWDG